MDKLRQLLARLETLDYTRLLTLSLIAKAVVFGVSYADCLVAVPVLTFEAYKLYLKTKVQDPIKINAEVQEQLDNIKLRLSAQTMEKNTTEPRKRYF